MPRLIPALALALVALVATALPAAAQSGDDDSAQRPTSASLPSVDSGARPGPDVLYAPRPDAPQLENGQAAFDAEPILVSGEEAYRDGEYLYQDYLYDDYGSDTNGSAVESNPASLGDSDQNGAVPRVGDITYPTNRARYGGNAADLVEFRIATGPDAVTYRFTLNTLLEADSTIATVAFDTDAQAATGKATLPRDPGTPFPGTDQVITTWGTGAEHTNLSGATPQTTELDVTADLEANQLVVTVPREVSDPSGVWEATVAVGLYDPATGGWKRPQVQAGSDTPGGAGPLDPNPSGIFNLGFRFDEPVAQMNTPPDTEQSVAIRTKAPNEYTHEIDFGALAAGENRSSVPETGTQIRIFPSRLDLGEGRNLDRFPAYLGQLQPYSVYVPSGYDPADSAGLTLLLHSLGQEHWQYNGTNLVQQVGEARGNIVATSLSRGPDGWYQRSAEYDVFEMWNDVARQFELDPDRVAISGYSMGGYATYRLGGLYPDLFGKAFSQVGPPGEGIWLPPAPPTGATRGNDQPPPQAPAPATNSNRWLENTRHVPFLNWVAGEDQLVPTPGPRAQNLGAPELGIDGFDQLGYRFQFQVFSPAEHFTLFLNDEYPGTADFLGQATVDRNPAHVTFAHLPASDDTELGLVHDHAYWVSQVAVDETSGSEPAKGVVDAFSHAFGVGDPPSTRTTSTGTQPLPYTQVKRTWGERPQIPAQNLLEVELTNVGSAELDMPRARIDPKQTTVLEITADRAGELDLTGAFPAGARVLRDGEELDSASAGPDGATLPIAAGEHRYEIVPPVDRFGGDDRVGTAAEVSRATHGDAETVVLARSDEYADALAGGPLATDLDAPLLLSRPGGVSEAAAEEIERLGAGNAVLLGGEVALSDQVRADLEEMGVSVRRVGGANRFATAARIADELPDGPEVFVAEGANADESRGWPDALSASGLASVQTRPVLLVTRDQLPQATADALESDEDATIVGGQMAVSAGVAQAVDERASETSRLAGETRYATSAAVADEALARGIEPTVTWAATGRDYADGLIAGAAVGADQSVLVLVDGQSLDGSPASRQWLADHGDASEALRLAGGNAAITEQVEQRLRSLVTSG
jgi:putative cell wall-binding protein